MLQGHKEGIKGFRRHNLIEIFCHLILNKAEILSKPSVHQFVGICITHIAYNRSNKNFKKTTEKNASTEMGQKYVP